MSARDRILARVSAARRTAAPAARGRAAVSLPRADLDDVFFARVARLGSDVTRVTTTADAPAAVAAYLKTHRLARHAICWPDLLGLPWQGAGIDVETRAAAGGDALGITGAFAAIAETGTLMLLSGPRTPATVSLLPETHVALVQRGLIVPTMEDAWAKLRTLGAPPRAVNFVSGPSRTADVEQTVTLGAHGPRRVLVVLIDS